MTLKKFFAPLAAVALVAVMAISLVAQTSAASAVVNGISLSATTTNPGTAGVILSIDANEGDGNVRVLATSGEFTACTDDPATNAVADACVIVAGSVNPGAGNALDGAGAILQTDFTVNDTGGGAGANTDNLNVVWTAPATGPQTVTFTVIQGTSTKTVNITVRGTVDKVELTILNGASTSTTACSGINAEAIRSTTATAGLAAGTLCTRVLDSAGNRLPTAPVVYSTTAGTFGGVGLTDTTGATGQVAAASTIVFGTTGLSNTTATVTASSGGKTATDTVKFGGDPATCTVTANPTSVAPGGASTITVDVKDAAGGAVPDTHVINVAQVNVGQGANAAVLNGAPTTTNGVATTTVIAAITGSVGIGASSATLNPGATCTGTLLVSGAPVPPTPPAGGTTGTFTGAVIAPAGLTIVSFTGTHAQLTSAGTAAKVVSASGTFSGSLLTFVIGAPDFVNVQFVAATPTGLNNTLLIVKTGN